MEKAIAFTLEVPTGKGLFRGKNSIMEDRKKPTRGLEEVSHFFLSSQSPPYDAKKLPGKNLLADDSEITPLPSEISRKERHLLFSSSDSLLTEKSFLACNLAMELARRNFTVALVETTTKLPNIFFLLGSLLPGSTKEKRATSSLEKLLTVPSTLPPPEPLKLVDISTGYYRNIKAVFLEKDLDSADSFTIFSTLYSESDFLIMNTPSDIFEFKKTISLISPFFIVPTTVHSEELLRSYSLIKQISEEVACKDVGLLIMKEGPHQKAEGAFNIIAEMAHKFLSTDLHFMGTIQKGDDFSRSILTRTPLLLEVPNSPISRLIRKLADSLIKKHSHVKETNNVKGNL